MSDEPLDPSQIDRPWVELRIHGVSGTPPEVMLESAHVQQVAGDGWGRFLRPVNGVGEPLQTVPGRLLEGYHWGRYTSGSWIKGLWLVLVPCGLVNAAAFMVPAPGAGRWHKRLHGWVQAAVRSLGLGVTGTFALASALILVDLVGWQWSARLPWLAHVHRGAVITVCVLGAAGVMVALFFLGNRNRVSDFSPADPSALDLPADAASGLRRPEFFEVPREAGPTLGRLHLAFGLGVVSLVSSLVWTGSDASAGDWRRADQVISYWGSLGVLVLVAVVVWSMGDPNKALVGSEHTLLSVKALRWLAVLALALSGLTLLAAATLVSGISSTVGSLDFDRYAAILSSLTGLSMLVLLALLGLLAFLTRDAEHPPRQFRRFGGGLAGWAASSVGVFLGVGFCAAFVLTASRALHGERPTELIYRIAYAWGLTSALLLVLVAWIVVRLLVHARTLRPAAAAAYDGVTTAGLGAPDGKRWEGRIARAMSAATLKKLVAPPFILFALAGLVMTAGTSVELVVEGFDLHPSRPGWLRWLGVLSEGRVPGTANQTFTTFMINLGTYSLLGLAAALFYFGRRALRTEGTRRGVNVIWDVISFWPHSAHPFVPPAYSQFAVHDLRRRIRFHLGLPPVPVPGKDEPAVPPDAPLVVLSAHSQGSLIAFATLLWLSAQEREHVRLVTYGSQLQVAYPRGFPAYVDYDLVCAVKAAWQGRWVNLFRETDPIAGPVLSWDRTRPPDPAGSKRVPISGSAAVQPLTPDEASTPTGVRRCGDDWRVLDPQPVDPQLQATSLTHLSKHSAYPATQDYCDAVTAVRVARLSTTAGSGRSG